MLMLDAVAEENSGEIATELDKRMNRKNRIQTKAKQNKTDVRQDMYHAYKVVTSTL